MARLFLHETTEAVDATNRSPGLIMTGIHDQSTYVPTLSRGDETFAMGVTLKTENGRALR